MTGPRSVTIGDETITVRVGIVIATGSKASVPQIAGLDQVDYWTTHDVIEAKSLPTSIVVLGGGAVGCELGRVMARFGVSVTIVEAGDRLLPAEEPEVSEVVAAAFVAEDIQIQRGAPPFRRSVPSTDSLL